jgi:hypothetical protein
MNQPYSENLLAVILILLLTSLAGLSVCLLAGLKRILAGPVRQAIRHRRARRCAARVAERTDSNAALAKLTKENGQ